MSRKYWAQLEPARSVPLLPAWPWHHPVAASTPVVIRGLTTGWQIHSLGNPAASRYPACWQSLPRTPWDLALFDGRLVVGLGNAANDGATANAGPVPVFAYGLADRRWRQEATLPEEEISRFVAHGHQLWIAGADARGSWRWGNLYSRTDAGGWWWQERRLPRFIHAHDLAFHQGLLVVAGNVPDAVPFGPERNRHGSALAVSADGGRTWSVTRLAGWRATALLPVGGQLLAIEAIPGPAQRRWLQAGGRWDRDAVVHQWLSEGHWRARHDLGASDLLPGVTGADQRFAWIERATPSGDQVAWIATVGPWRHQPAQRLAFIASWPEGGDLEVQSIPLGSGVQAMDLRPIPMGWLLLSSERLAPQRWRSQISAVQASAGHLSQVPRLSFEAALPAWSLVGDGNPWWVGLGHPPFQPESGPGHCSPADALSGSVLEISAAGPPVTLH